MKFTSIPEAYSSFREPLLYAFDTEHTEPQDVEFRIINKADNTVIGRKRLYGVTEGEVDIAPYLRSVAVTTLPDAITECGVVDTNAQIKVVVEAEGVSSAVRNFIAAKVDLNEIYTPLMTQHLHRTMARDEFDLISFFSLPNITVEVVVEFFRKGP